MGHEEGTEDGLGLSHPAWSKGATASWVGSPSRSGAVRGRGREKTEDTLVRSRAGRHWTPEWAQPLPQRPPDLPAGDASSCPLQRAAGARFRSRSCPWTPSWLPGKTTTQDGQTPHGDHMRPDREGPGLRAGHGPRASSVRDQGQHGRQGATLQTDIHQLVSALVGPGGCHASSLRHADLAAALHSPAHRGTETGPGGRLPTHAHVLSCGDARGTQGNPQERAGHWGVHSQACHSSPSCSQTGSPRGFRVSRPGAGRLGLETPRGSVGVRREAEAWLPSLLHMWLFCPSRPFGTRPP